MRWSLHPFLLGLGAVVGFFLGRFSSMFPVEKIEKFQLQWDIGNSIVGAATALLAFSTFYMGQKNITKQNDQKIAEFRLQWVKDVRQAVAIFAGLAEQMRRQMIQLGSMNIGETDPAFKNIETTGRQIAEQRANLGILLNSKDSDQELVLNCCSSISQKLTEIGSLSLKRPINSADISKNNQELLGNIEQLSVSSRAVIESQWDRIESEVRKGT